MKIPYVWLHVLNDFVFVLKAGIGGGGREGGVLADPMPSMSAAMCDPGHHHEVPSHHHYQHHQPHHTATASFHISRPTNPISQIISPPLMHHASIILDDHGSFHAPRIILPNDNFQVLYILSLSSKLHVLLLLTSTHYPWAVT